MSDYTRATVCISNIMYESFTAIKVGRFFARNVTSFYRSNVFQNTQRMK